MNDTHPDEYTGIVVNDEATTLPPGAKLNVTIDTRDWEHFEEMVSYLNSVELPGFSKPARSMAAQYVGDKPSVIRHNADFSIFMRVNSPVNGPALTVADPAFIRVQEVVNRVIDAA